MNEDAPVQGARSRSVSTALFSAATGLSRVLGLVREVISAQLLGVSGPASAFVVANNVPNTVRSLVAALRPRASCPGLAPFPDPTHRTGRRNAKPGSSRPARKTAINRRDDTTP